MSSYGAWISKDNIITVKEECHPESAYEILSERFHHNELITLHNPIYRVMFRLGYIRLINTRDNSGYFVEYWQGIKLTKFQKDIIDNAIEKYPLKIYSHEWKSDKIQ